MIKGITKSAVNQQLKKLCNEGKLQKYENGIYYLPKKSRLKTSVGVNADTVARYKYVSRGGKVDGFYSGNTFANQLGISTQVPNKVEIVSNNMAAKVREVPIGKRTFIVRKPVVPVNEENVYVLCIWMKAMMWLMIKYLNLCGYMASQKKTWIVI